MHEAISFGEEEGWSRTQKGALMKGRKPTPSATIARETMAARRPAFGEGNSLATSKTSWKKVATMRDKPRSTSKREDQEPCDSNKTHRGAPLLVGMSSPVDERVKV